MLLDSGFRLGGFEGLCDVCGVGGSVGVGELTGRRERVCGGDHIEKRWRMEERENKL